MPDILTHYLASYLISSRVTKIKYSLIIALAGLLPDVDAVFRIHRWVTHSLIVTLAALTPTLIIIYLIRREYVRVAVLAASLYVTHIILDTLTSPTPILWPLTPSTWVRIEVSGRVGSGGPSVGVTVATVTEPADFTRRAYVEGPIVSEVGLILAVVTVALTATEYLAIRRRV